VISSISAQSARPRPILRIQYGRCHLADTAPTIYAFHSAMPPPRKSWISATAPILAPLQIFQSPE